MAKKKAKRKVSPKKATPIKKKKKAKTPVATDGLGAPNHNTPLDLHELAELGFVDDTSRFPILRLMLSDSGCGLPAGMAFVDSIYGTTSWVDRAIGAPPTWMDPEIFVRMCVNDKVLVQLGAKALKADTAANNKAIVKRLEELLDEKYIPYLKDRFSNACEVLMAWLKAYYADQVKNPGAIKEWRKSKGLSVAKRKKKAI